MGAFPSAANQLRPPADPLSEYAKALSIKSMIGQQQSQVLGQQALGQENQLRQQQINDQQATTAAMHEWDGKSYDDLLPLIVKHGGSSQAVIGLKNVILGQQEKLSNIAKNDAETGAKNLETAQKKNDMLLGHLNALPDPSDPNFINALQTEKNAALAGGYLDKQHADMIDQLASTNDPQRIGPALDMFKKSLLGQKEQFDQAMKERDTASKEWKDFPGIGAMVNSRTGEVRDVSGGVMTPAQLESKYVNLQTQIAQGGKLSDADSAFIKGYEKMKTLVPMFNFNLAGGATGGLDQAAIDQQAEKYFQTGQLPPVGRSAAGLALSRQIMERASQIHPGESLAAGSAAYHANTASLKALQSNLDQVSAFEQTAVKNLDMFTGLARKAIDSGVPLVNAPLRTAANLLGSSDQANFNAARQVAINEIAKVTSSPGLSGQLSDTARREVADFIPQSATVGQILHLADTLKQDMANRRMSYQDQIGQIKGRLGQTGAAGGGGVKTLTQSQIEQAAKDHNVSIEEATRQAKAAGYEVKP